MRSTNQPTKGRIFSCKLLSAVQYASPLQPEFYEPRFIIRVAYLLNFAVAKLDSYHQLASPLPVDWHWLVSRLFAF